MHDALASVQFFTSVSFKSSQPVAASCLSLDRVSAWHPELTEVVIQTEVTAMTIDSKFLWRLEALDQRGLFSIDATETAFSTIQIRQIPNLCRNGLSFDTKGYVLFFLGGILVPFSAEFSWHLDNLENLSNTNSLGIERSL